MADGNNAGMMQRAMISTAAVLAAVALMAACGGSTESATSEPPATDPSTTEPVATDAPAATDAPPATDAPVATDAPTATDAPVVTEAPVATEAPVEESTWARIVPDSEDCACSDGSEFAFFERPADPTKVMFYFEGGGACFSAATCDPDGDPTYSTVIDDDVTDGLDARRGLFNATDERNPLADYSIVYVPYCTGDVHLGNATNDYGDGVVIEHRGGANAAAATEYVLANYPEVEQLFVTGASAGSVPAPLIAGIAADALPDADVVAFGDSSGAYPDVPAVNELIGGLWGTVNAIPPWPVNEGLTAAEWSFPGLTVQASQHTPDVTFARFDYAFDGVQATFSALAGVGADRVVEQIDATEAQIEASGVELSTYVAPGTEHTIIGGDLVYEMEVEGVLLIDWITELVEGGQPDDVHCVECQL